MAFWRIKTQDILHNSPDFPAVIKQLIMKVLPSAFIVAIVSSKRLSEIWTAYNISVMLAAICKLVSSKRGCEALLYLKAMSRPCNGAAETAMRRFSSAIIMSFSSCKTIDSMTSLLLLLPTIGSSSSTEQCPYLRT